MDTTKTAFKLPEYLHVFEGALYDTRKPDWSKQAIRQNYKCAHRDIKTTADLKATLRVKYAWPGGYEIVYLTNDGAILCDGCVRKNLRSIFDDIKQPIGYGTGWRIVSACYEAISAQCAIDAGVETSYCDQCGKEFGELA